MSSYRTILHPDANEAIPSGSDDRNRACRRSGHARNKAAVSSRTDGRWSARTTGGTHHVQPADRVLGAGEPPPASRRTLLVGAARAPGRERVPQRVQTHASAGPSAGG